VKTVALTTVSHSVTDLEKTMTFYQRVFGFEPLRAAGRPAINGAMDKLHNTPGAKYRQASMRLPATGLLLRFLEFTGVERTAHTPRQIDPGQSRLRIWVVDIELTVANLQRFGAQFVSPSGASVPAPRSGAAGPFLVRDIDGYLLEVARGQGSQPVAFGSSVIDVRLAMTTEDSDKKVSFYKDVLGLDLTAGTWTKTGTGTAEVRETSMKDVGGPGRHVEFSEFRNAGEKTPFRPRVQDPNAAMVSFVVRDLAAIVKQVQEAKVIIVTTPAEPVVVGVATGNLPRIIVQDPDGAFVELIQS
jgi:catechol 2,3-dioxygenase-like lactoylglutathione lyase family enzyme